MARRAVLLALGGVAGAAAALAAHAQAAGAVARIWPPFALVAGLLLIGAVAQDDGFFAAAGDRLSRLPGGDLSVYAAAMALVAAVTAVLNLDTAVAFLTAPLVHLARRRGAGELRLLYGCVFMANAASLLLPGSNLTNLLVLANEHVNGSVFLAHMAVPWLVSVAVTMLVVALAFSRSDRRAAAEAARPECSEPPAAMRGRLGALGIVAAVVLTLALGDPALPMLGLGVALVAVRLAQRRIAMSVITRAVDVATLAAVFLFCIALGTLARTWTYPADVMAGAGRTAAAAAGAIVAVLVNNLPAAVLLGSRTPAHPRALLAGLDIGPNLAVTGSLSALIWWQAARSAGARPSLLRYSTVGVVLVPLTIAAALLAGRAVL